jgi:hypothetical protein
MTPNFSYLEATKILRVRLRININRLAPIILKVCLKKMSIVATHRMKSSKMERFQAALISKSLSNKGAIRNQKRIN